MPLTYEGPSLNTATAEEHGPLVYEYPFDKLGDTSHFIASQVYRQIAGDYTPPTLDATRTLKSVTTYCVGDTTPQPIEAGLVEFTRRWSTIPATRDDFATVSYQFPGYQYNTGDIFIDRGGPRSLTVTARMELEYFLCATGQTYETPAEIPVIERQRFILTYGTQGDSDVDYVLFSAFAGFETAPTATAYQAMVAAADEIVAEDSQIERYAGNIWCRVTKYVAAR
jgi:hypothetical protein